MEKNTTNGEILGFMKEQFERIDARFDAVDARFEAQDARLDTLGARVDSFEESTNFKLDGVNKRIDDLAQSIFVREDVLGRVELLEKEVRNLVKLAIGK